MKRRFGRADVEWETPLAPSFAWDHVAIEVLMDIRNELKRMNNILQCPNFIAVPAKLDQIARNTKKRRRPKVVDKPKLRVVR